MRAQYIVGSQREKTESEIKPNKGGGEVDGRSRESGSIGGGGGGKEQSYYFSRIRRGESFLHPPLSLGGKQGCSSKQKGGKEWEIVGSGKGVFSSPQPPPRYHRRHRTKNGGENLAAFRS